MLYLFSAELFTEGKTNAAQIGYSARGENKTLRRENMYRTSLKKEHAGGILKNCVMNEEG